MPCEKIHPFYLSRYFWFATLAGKAFVDPVNNQSVLAGISPHGVRLFLAGVLLLHVGIQVARAENVRVMCEQGKE